MISSWSLVKDLEDLIKNETTSERHRHLAEICLDAYMFPVQMTVMSPDGVVLGSENANSFMSAVEKEHGFDDWGNEETPLDAEYLQFLKRSSDEFN
jgi:hypothetical protein